MAGRQLHTLIQYLRRTVHPRGEDTLSDAQLLERWAKQRDEAAFEVLLWRHGAMVLAVCRRLLRDNHDIEDAFQAAFLTLVRKSSSIRHREALAAWLYRVAYRIALRLRTQADERARREQPGVENLIGAEADEAGARDLRAVVDEEIDALPERYRQAFVLCCLEGKTHAEAGRLLGRPAGTISCWLKRGRERLRQRLARRGFALATLVAVAESEAEAVLPVALVRATARAATVFATGGDGVAATISARVAPLVEAAARGTAATKLHSGLVLGLTLAMAAAGAGMWAYQPPAKHEDKAQAPEQPRKQAGQQTRTDRYGDPLPEGVIARLGTVRLRAVGASAAFSSDGKRILTITYGRLVKLWDADTGKPLARRELPINSPGQVDLSPDGRLLMVRESGFDSPLDIWDIPTSKRLHRLQLRQRVTIYREAFSPDSKMLAVAEHGAGKSVIRLWDMESGEQRELKGQASTPESLAFSPDGKLFAAADNQRIICWNVAKREILWQTRGTYGISLAFTADGRTVIGSPGHRERTWHAWDTATGKPVSGLKLPEGYNYAKSAVAPDDRILVFVQGRNVQGSDGRVRLWDLRTGKLRHTLTAEGNIGPFAPDGKSLLTNDGVLQRWNLETGQPLLPDTDKMGHRSEVSCAVYSPDGRRLASAARDDTIRLWDVAKAKPLHILRGHEASALAFTPDGKHLVSGGIEGDWYIWNTETGKVVRRIPLHDPKGGEKKQNVWRLHVTPDGRTVLVLGYDPDDSIGVNGILSRWDLATGQRKNHVKTGPSDGFYGGFSPDGRTLASHGELLDTATGKVRVKLEGEPGYLPHYAFTSDGRYVAGHLTRTVQEPMRFTTKFEGIRIWEAATGRARRLLPTDWVGQLAFSPDGRYLAAADSKGLRLWEWTTGQVVLKHKAHEQMRGSYGQSFASCLSFAPDGRSLATGHLDSTILIWNLVPSSLPPTAADLPRLWEELIATDAARAYAASWQLVEAPKEAIRFLRERLRPVAPVSAETVRPLLAELDSDDFSKREAAAARLRKLEDRAAGYLNEALKARPSLEMRRRVEELLKRLEEPPSGEVLRALRAVAVLERIGTAEARQILKTLAQGMPEARVTREAKVSLERLAARRPAEKR